MIKIKVKKEIIDMDALENDYWIASAGTETSTHHVLCVDKNNAIKIVKREIAKELPKLNLKDCDFSIHDEE
jgi:Fe2+ or Zn2+ uptake regulation protein